MRLLEVRQVALEQLPGHIGEQPSAIAGVVVRGAAAAVLHAAQCHEGLRARQGSKILAEHQMHARESGLFVSKSWSGRMWRWAVDWGRFRRRMAHLLNDVMAGDVVQVGNEAHLQAENDIWSACEQATCSRLSRCSISQGWTAASSSDHRVLRRTDQQPGPPQRYEMGRAAPRTRPAPRGWCSNQLPG